MTSPPRISRSPVPLDRCHLAQSIDLIGERWTLLILRAAMFGVRRFDDFQEELGCPRTVLSGRLKKLDQAGILDRKPYREPGRRTRYEYVLTEKGRALQPVLVMLTQWGDAHVGNGTPPPVRFADTKTRKPVHAGFIGSTGRSVPADRLRVKVRRG
ncbi:MAG: helix-turn-helix domain-containing protein [Pseudomonadota bacterium]